MPDRTQRGAPSAPLQAVAALLSGVGGVTAPSSPSALAVADAIYRFGLAAVVPLAAARSTSATWVVLSGISAAATTGWAQLAAAASLIMTVGAVLLRRDHPLVGLVVGAASSQALLRMDVAGFHGSSALLAAVALAPTIFSAGRRLDPSSRRRLTLLYGAASAIALTFAAAGFAALATGYGEIERGVDSARMGLDASRDGETDRAVEHFERSSEEFAAAHGSFASWLSRPALALPVVGQQIEALERASGESSELMGLAAREATEADLESLHFEEGRIDIGRIAEMEQPLRDVESALSNGLRSLEAVQSAWLLPPISDRLGSLLSEIRSAEEEAELAIEAVEIAPELLGSEGPRTYVVMFTTPAEARGMGGFMGSWAELRAHGGQVELVQTGRGADLTRLPGAADRVLEAPEDYLERYSRFQPEMFMGDITLSPDFPTVSEVLASLFRQSMGIEPDGVILVDPFALAALLELSGPIRVEGLDETLSSENAAQFLLRDQYRLFRTEAEQKDVLDAVAEATLDALLAARRLPGPREVVRTLGPVVREDRLLVNSLQSAEQDFLRRVGLDGRFAQPGEGDFFALVTQNGGNNKIDAYLKRAVTYDVQLDPTTGLLRVRATITLLNQAPNTGLPDDVIGNSKDLPVGTNRLYLSFYSPHLLEEAKVGGETQPFEVHQELGWNVYSRYVEIPPKGEVQVELDLEGALPEPSRYTLRIDHQPLARDDDVTIELRLPPGWQLDPVSDPDRRSGMIPGTFPLREDLKLEVLYRPG